MENTKYKDLFLTKANATHNGFYDYSKVHYVNTYTNVEIICPKHGSFLQKPETHLRGSGCQLCGKEKAYKAVMGRINASSKSTAPTVIEEKSASPAPVIDPAFTNYFSREIKAQEEKIAACQKNISQIEEDYNSINVRLDTVTQKLNAPIKIVDITADLIKSREDLEFQESKFCAEKQKIEEKLLQLKQLLSQAETDYKVLSTLLNNVSDLNLKA
jgi:archaellum component FlaC